MSEMDAYESDMGWLSKLSDEEIERVLAGEYSGDDASLADLTAFARDAKSRFAAAPDVATRAAHMVAMAEAAAELGGTPARAPKPAPSSPFRKVKLVLTSLLASLVAKIALVGVALAATTGGLAATGSLPQPAQEALARASERVGFELPAGDDAEERTNDREAGVPEQLPETTEGSSAPSVLDVIRSWDDDKGCEFGHAVATAAGGDSGECRDEQGGDDEAESDGKSQGNGGGRPEGAGKPEGTPDGRPSGAGAGQGKPEGTPNSKPEGTGKPEGTPSGSGSEAEGNGSGNADRAGNSNGNRGVGPPGNSQSGSNDNGGGKPSSVPGGKP